MRRIRIILLRRDRDRAVALLQKLGTVDFRKSALNLPDDEGTDYYEVLPRLLSLVGGAVAALPKRPVYRMRHMEREKLIRAAGKEMDAIGRIQELDSDRKELEDKIGEAELKGDEDPKGYKVELKGIANELDEISSKHYSRLSCLKEMLEIETARAEAFLMFKRTKDTCIIEGWMPARDEKELREKLKAAVSGRYSIEHVRTKEEQPTYYRVPELLGSFDYLVSLYSTPRSDEVNPAWFLMISFPILYGLMVSDAGYGVVSLLLSIFIARRTEKQGLLHNMANIWLLASIFTIIFGIFNDQFFGFPVDKYIFPSFKAFDWANNVHTVITVSILIGIAQMSIGLCLGIWNNIRRRRFGYAAAKLMLLMTLISGTVAVAGLLFHAVSASMAIESAALSLVSIFLLVLINSAQWGRLIDMIVYPISYVRIMGFGFASVLIASVINDAFTPDIGSGIGVFLLYLVVFVILHALNMALSTLEGAIQSVRLNFLEFFEEFYTGKGVKFRPFAYRRIHTYE